MADFGLTEDMYTTNYFCRGENVVRSEEKVPIKWMAPESIESSLYNETTDVVRVNYISETLYEGMASTCPSSPNLHTTPERCSYKPFRHIMWSKGVCIHNKTQSRQKRAARVD